MKKALIGVFIFVMSCGFSFLITAGVTTVLSFCFGFTFTWKLVLGVWIILWVLNVMFKKRKE